MVYVLGKYKNRAQTFVLRRAKKIYFYVIRFFVILSC